nr:GNAT family N-acetyltransferase [Pantoea sp. 201603H]
MKLHFRQLTLDDRHEYLALMLTAYAPIRELGIHFDAATADLARVSLHLEQHAVYALFADDTLASSLTLRFPWGPLPGPFGLPHIGWFGTDPQFRGRQLGRHLLEWVEQHILHDRLKAPAVSLGTAINHPWLKEMYQQLGFVPQHQTDLGKGHITLYMKKILDDAAHTQWMRKHATDANNPVAAPSASSVSQELR